MRETLRRHPHALPILATRPNLSAAGFRLTDRTLGVLVEAGLPAAEALSFVNAAGEFLLSHALAEASPPPVGPATAGDDEILPAVDNAGEHYPHLTAALAATDLHEVTMDRIFEAGLAALRRGLEARLTELRGDANAGDGDGSGSGRSVRVRRRPPPAGDGCRRRTGC